MNSIIQTESPLFSSMEKEKYWAQCFAVLTRLQIAPPNCRSDLIISIPVHPGLSQWKSYHLHLLHLQLTVSEPYIIAGLTTVLIFLELAGLKYQKTA